MVRVGSEDELRSLMGVEAGDERREREAWRELVRERTPRERERDIEVELRRDSQGSRRSLKLSSRSVKMAEKGVMPIPPPTMIE